MNHNTVLIVEDDQSLRDLLSEILRNEKYHVATAENGEQALEILNSNDEIALLLSDAQMKPIGGQHYVVTN